ncbi:phosphonate C-P lyase system protein PhnG [Neptunomonas antarctica]|uniref:Methylphosphonate degradation complex, subunit phnG n=1 Tax=Neptunomonas antarctica TaxID=619304 RepID=A0A1N7JUI2_9GAMM|nr:phosphonate C-P lyase system protein PhnG [Neptunomonas antarctica]SIS52864.1 methylphosphonate degradation complex, subunit phnG [Neptunomonas antarctica]
MEHTPLKERSNTVNYQLNDRQRWMSVMAKSSGELLHNLSDSLIDTAQFETIRAPEVGLTQVRARMGGTGSQFNLGDMTITRCVVRSIAGHYGYSYIAGRNKAHALRAAELDALLQSSNNGSTIRQQVIELLEEQLMREQQQKTAETSTTKVNFFTLVRGED